MNNYAKTLIIGRCVECGTEIVRIYLKVNGNKHVLLWCPNCKNFIIPPKLLENNVLKRKLIRLKRRLLEKTIVA